MPLILIILFLSILLPCRATLTLVQRETFQGIGTLTSANPGNNFNSVTGSLYKRPVGPRVTGDTSVNSEGWSADVHNATAYNVWQIAGGRPANPTTTFNGMACGWFFLGNLTTDGANGRETDFLTCKDPSNNALFTSVAMGNTFGLYQDINYGLDSPVVATPLNGWIFLAVAWVYAPSSYDTVVYRSYYMLPGGSLTQLGSDSTQNGYYDGINVTMGQMPNASQIHVQMRYGCPSLYHIATFSDVAVPGDLLAPPTSGKSWYLNPVTGNDGNDGTSPSTAWQTISKLQTETSNLGMIPSNGTGPVNTSGSSPGDTLYIDCSGGSLLIGSSALTIDTAGLTIKETQISGTYGGTPITGGYGLDPMKTMPNSEWAAVSGTTNTYSTTDGGAADLTSIVVFEDGKYLNHPTGSSLSAVKSSLDSTPGSFWTDGTTVYLHTFEGGNPAAGAHVFRRTRYRDGNGDSVVLIQAPNIWWDGFVCAGTTLADETTNDPVGAYCFQWNSGAGGTNLLSNFNVNNYAKHGVGRSTGGSNMICTRQNGVYGQASPYVGFGQASADVDYSGDSTSVNNQGIFINCGETVNRGVIGSSAGTVDGYDILAYITHASSVMMSNLSFANCSFVGPLVDEGSAAQITCSNTTCYSTSFGSPATFDRCKTTSGVLATTGSPCIITNSIMHVTGFTTAYSGSLGLNATILGCVFDLTGNSGSLFKGVYTRGSSGSSLTVRDCLFLGPTATAFQYALTYGYSSSDSLVLDNNIYTPLTGGAVYGAGNYTSSGGSTTPQVSFSNWQSSGFESGSLVTDTPNVNNATYKPNSGSPCITSGVNIGPLDDYTSQIYTVRQTVGAIEVPDSSQLNLFFGSSSSPGVTANGYTASGQVLNVSLNFVPTLGAVLTVIDNTGSSLINGTFTNLSNGGKISLAYEGVVYVFTADYAGGDGNDLTLTYVNGAAASDTPTMPLLALLILAGLLVATASTLLPKPKISVNRS